MTSNRHRANQLNAQKSTGPRTDEGRRRASLNRLVHGLRASTAVLPGEDPVQLEELRTGLQEELQPRGPVEEFLVKRIALGMWRLRRAERAERGILFDQLLGVEAERAERDRRASESTCFDALEFGTRITDERGHAEATAQLMEIERLREGEVPMLGAAVVRDAAGPGALEVVARYEMTIERGVLRALHELRDLQATRSRS